jgi:hypothetical protein
MDDWFYFVCFCGAKWFAQSKRDRCPRCEAKSSSSIKMNPPWLKNPQADKPADKPSWSQRNLFGISEN